MDFDAVRLSQATAGDGLHVHTAALEYGHNHAHEQHFCAVSSGIACYRCGGAGHLARDCATPKGDGKGNRKGGKSHGKRNLFVNMMPHKPKT